MNHRQFAEQWIESTFRVDFRFGWLIYDTPEAHTVAVRNVRPQQPKSRERLSPRFLQFSSQLFGELDRSEITIEQARSRIEKAGLSRYLRVVRTREQLIDAISEIMEDGANAWSDGGKWAWREDGVFVCVFWYDPSHR